MAKDRRDQYKVADLLANLASGQRPSLTERSFLLDLSERIATLDLRVRTELPAIATAMRSEREIRVTNEYGFIETQYMKDLFTPAQRKALWHVMNLLQLISPYDSPIDKAE